MENRIHYEVCILPKDGGIMYYSYKWLRKNTLCRRTREVNITLQISGDGKEITIRGVGDCEHHLIEDLAIVVNKLAEERVHKVYNERIGK